MKTRFFLTAAAMAALMPLAAQETYENAKIATEDLNGTARYVGMGGAGDALGADISTISTNPAGIGLFRHSKVDVSAGMVSQQDATDYSEGDATNLSFDQVGFVWASRKSDSSFFNFAFNYHKSRNFDFILSASDRLSDASQNKLTYMKLYNDLLYNLRGADGEFSIDHPTSSCNQLDDIYVRNLLFAAGDGNAYFYPAENYVFDREDSDKKTVMRFKGAFPKGRPFTWDEVGHMGQSQFIMMHTIIYRREVLLASGTRLPEHAYYVDNVYAFQPLAFTKKIYYLDEALYHYRIGRADQSVNVQVQLKNIDQQIMVDKLITDIYVRRPKDLPAKLEKYLIAFVKLMYCATSAILLVGGSAEHLAKKEELWNYLKQADPAAYKKIRHSFMGGWMNIPTALGRKISVGGYKLSQKIFSFN